MVTGGFSFSVGVFEEEEFSLGFDELEDESLDESEETEEELSNASFEDCVEESVCVDADEDVGEVSTAQAMPERVKISDNSAMGINFNFFIFNTPFFMCVRKTPKVL